MPSSTLDNVITTTETEVAAEAGMQVLAWLDRGRVAFAAMKPKAMQRLFFISSYEKFDPDSPAPKGHGYQREPLKERIPRIAEYFLSGEHEFLITPLITSVRLEDIDDIEDFVQRFNAGDAEGIHKKWKRSTVSVVDGQHRFLGLAEAHRRNPDFDPWVPVVLYFDLEYISEAELFDTINTTARKLPKALIEVTKGDITETDPGKWAQQVRTVAFALARDTDSVWSGRINMTGARDANRKVTYEGLRRSTSNMLPAELMQRLSKVGLSPEEVAKRYWELVADACKPAWDEVLPPEYEDAEDETDPETGETVKADKFPGYRLLDLVGVASVARLGRDIVTSALEAKDFDHRMGELVEKLSEVDWVKGEGNPWMRSQAGFAGQKELYGVLFNLVYLDRKPGEEA